MRKLMVALLSLGLIAVFATPAYAQAEAIQDPDDAGGKLDIRIFSASQDPDNGPLTLTISTYDKWRCRYLGMNKDTKLIVKFDDHGTNGADYRGRFRCAQGELLFFMTSTDGDQFEPLPASRPNRRTVKTTIPGGFFEGTPEMWARSLDGEADGCNPCKDRAPDSGRLFD